MKVCPFCNQAIELDAKYSGGLFWIECNNGDCGAQGPMRDTREQAIAAWDEAIRVTTDPNSPCRHLDFCPVCNPNLKDRT